LCLCMWAGEDDHRLCYHVCVCFVWCVSCVCICGLAKTITGCVTMFVCVLFGVSVGKDDHRLCYHVCVCFVYHVCVCFV